MAVVQQWRFPLCRGKRPRVVNGEIGFFGKCEIAGESQGSGFCFAKIDEKNGRFEVNVTSCVSFWWRGVVF